MRARRKVRSGSRKLFKKAAIGVAAAAAVGSGVYCARRVHSWHQATKLKKALLSSIDSQVAARTASLRKPRISAPIRFSYRNYKMYKELKRTTGSSTSARNVLKIFAMNKAGR